MSNVLPALRRALDILPSPEADRPGLLLRDPLGYAEAVLYVPPTWALALQCLDGEHTELDVQELLTRATGGLVFSDEVREFVRVLRQEGFLETGEFELRREQRHKAFLALPERPAAHAGSAYPASAAEIRTTFAEYFNSVEIDAAGPTTSWEWPRRMSARRAGGTAMPRPTGVWPRSPPLPNGRSWCWEPHTGEPQGSSA